MIKCLARELFLTLISIGGCVFQSTGQMLLYNNSNTMQYSAVKLTNPSLTEKKRFGRATLFFGLGEAVPWSFDKYIAKADFANISFQTLGYNINPGSWSWDSDDFITNQLAHPAHGNIFFNAYRSNGYTFWQSVPAVFVGSYIWETAGETQAPSINDFINTSFGGVILGEMTHRLANKIINNHTRGVKRQLSEIFACMINPVNGLTRITNGQWGKVSDNSKERDSSLVATEFDAGMRRFSANGQQGKFGWYAHIKLMYGTPFEQYRTPFSYIEVNTEFGQDKTSIANVVTVSGSLTGFSVQSSDQVKHVGLLTVNYDYINNEAFFYSAQNIRFNLFSEFKLNKKLKVNTSAGAGAIVLAAVPDPYLYAGRPYDFCSGVGFIGSAGVDAGEKFFLNIRYRGGWVTTLSGNSSSYFIHTVTGEARYAFTDRVSICAEPGYFTLRGDYKFYENINKTYPYFRASVRYAVDFR